MERRRWSETTVFIGSLLDIRLAPGVLSSATYWAPEQVAGASFSDLFIAIHAYCVVYGIGYYAVFAAKISGTQCKYLYQKEAWGSQGDKQALECPN